MKFRKKPIAIEAFLLGVDETPDWFIKAMREKIAIINNTHVILYTLEGEMRADPGKDYIIKGIHGELYPCKKEIFEESYEPVEE